MEMTRLGADSVIVCFSAQVQICTTFIQRNEFMGLKNLMCEVSETKTYVEGNANIKQNGH